MKVQLIDGFRVGDDLHMEAELREATAGDMIEATEESERAVLTEEGYQLLVSNSLAGLNTLRRQIVRIGGHEGPFTIAELKKLSGRDLTLLNAGADTLQSASLKSVTERGKE